MFKTQNISWDHLNTGTICSYMDEKKSKSIHIHNYYIGLLLNSNLWYENNQKGRKQSQWILCAKITPHLTNNVYHNISSTFIEYVPFCVVVCPLFSRCFFLSLSLSCITHTIISNISFRILFDWYEDWNCRVCWTKIRQHWFGKNFFYVKPLLFVYDLF